MAYVYTWDEAVPLLTDLVRDGAAEIREGVKGALSERLLTVFVNLTSEPLKFKSLTTDHATYDIGADAARFRDAWLSRNLAVTGVAALGGLKVNNTGNSGFASAANQILLDMFYGGSPDPQMRLTAYGPDNATNASVFITSRRSDNTNTKVLLSYIASSATITFGYSGSAITLAGTLNDTIHGDNKSLYLGTTNIQLVGYDNGGGIKIIELRMAGSTVLMSDDSTKNVLVGYATGEILASAAGAGQTALSVYDGDAGSLQRVTKGAADSGGAGYKLLRIPN